MRVFSHTCSNTEIVCALGCADVLVGVDADSDHPPEVVARLPRPGRDLDLDTAAVAALRPDLVLTSLTVPGHERIVAEFQALGLRTLTIDPLSLEDVYTSIALIAGALGVAARGRALVDHMRERMPPVQHAHRPSVLVEWWPKPVIAAARQSWVHDLIELAGGRNACGTIEARSTTVDEAAQAQHRADAVVMSWCGVREAQYRAAVVRRRAAWRDWPALVHDRIHGVSEAYLGRPGPRLVEGYAALRRIVASIS